MWDSRSVLDGSENSNPSHRVNMLFSHEVDLVVRQGRARPQFLGHTLSHQLDRSRGIKIVCRCHSKFLAAALKWMRTFHISSSQASLGCGKSESSISQHC